MYTSLIEPYFRYCYSVWGCARTTILQKLKKLQNRAGRIATNSCYDAPSEQLIQELSWLNIEQLIKLQTVKVVYKTLHNEAPHYMKELIHKLSDTRSRQLRNSFTDRYIPRLMTSMSQKSFGYRGVRFCNDLIDEAKKSKHLHGFQKNSFQTKKTIMSTAFKIIFVVFFNISPSFA